MCVEENDYAKIILEESKLKSENTNVIFMVDAIMRRKNNNPIANSITDIINNNEKLGQKNLRFGLITYKDYCDPDSLKIVKPDTDFEKIKKKILKKKTISKVQPWRRDMLEAQYNALINGIPQLNLNPQESNVLVLIGDHGNHEEDKYTIDEVTQVLFKNQLNIISFVGKYL